MILQAYLFSFYYSTTSQRSSFQGISSILVLHANAVLTIIHPCCNGSSWHGCVVFNLLYVLTRSRASKYFIPKQLSFQEHRSCQHRTLVGPSTIVSQEMPQKRPLFMALLLLLGLFLLAYHQHVLYSKSKHVMFHIKLRSTSQ